MAGVEASSPPRKPRLAKDLGEFPNVYDAAFSWDRSREARTYLQVARSLMDRSPRSVVELACGTGALTRRWASWGLTAYGLDRSPVALAHARDMGQGTVPKDHWILGDLRSFCLPRKFDLAVVPLDSLGYLVEKDDLQQFFRSARESLVPGGILGIDLTLHPEGGAPLPIRNAWEVSLRPEGRLRVTWRSVGRCWGMPRRQWEVGRIMVWMRGQARQVFWEAAPHAALSAREIGRLAEAAGGLDEMVAYSQAAHRATSVRLRRVAGVETLTGPRLICWRRSGSRRT